MSNNPLGEKIIVPENYKPEILYPISRSTARSILGIDENLPMFGFDHWHAYELSWMNPRGKPQVAVAEFFFRADSENIVESKSLKLYLNSFNQEKIRDTVQLSSILRRDLSTASKSEVVVRVGDVEDKLFGVKEVSQGRSIDGLELDIDCYLPNSELLSVSDREMVEEDLSSQLFRSKCPITDAPDWGRVLICYTGKKIDEQSLLKYLCSYHQYKGYHEECAERIYRDLMHCCAPEKLTLSMNYLRRGGLDINVYRSSRPVRAQQTLPRIIRQ